MTEYAIVYAMIFVPLVACFLIGLYSQTLMRALLRTAGAVILVVLLYIASAFVLGTLPGAADTKATAMFLLTAWGYYSLVTLVPVLIAAGLGYGWKRLPRNDEPR